MEENFKSYVLAKITNKKTYRDILIIASIPTVFVVLNCLFATNVISNQLSDWLYIISFNVSITIILSLMTSWICKQLNRWYPWDKTSFVKRLILELFLHTLGASIIMGLYSKLWFWLIIPEYYEEGAIFYNIFLAVAIVLLVALIYEGRTLFGFWKNSLVQEQELKNQNLQVELEVLKAQINPHFLFNTLNGIYVLTRLNPELARENILKLSELLSHQIYESKKNWIDLNKEVEYLMNYIDLEKSRQAERVNVELNFPSIIPPIQVPPLLFIPFVENAFKHGLASNINLYNIKIDLLMEGNNLIFRCSNDCILNKINTNENSGFGLQNVQKRLNLIYANRAVLSLEKIEQKYHVKLVIKDIHG